MKRAFAMKKSIFFSFFFARCLDQFKLPGFLNEDNLNELFTRLVELSAKKSTKLKYEDTFLKNKKTHNILHIYMRYA